MRCRCRGVPLAGTGINALAPSTKLVADDPLVPMSAGAAVVANVVDGVNGRGDAHPDEDSVCAELELDRQAPGLRLPIGCGGGVAAWPMFAPPKDAKRVPAHPSSDGGVWLRLRVTPPGASYVAAHIANFSLSPHAQPTRKRFKKDSRPLE